MEKPKVWPPMYPKSLNFFEPKFAQMITSGISPDVQNLVWIPFTGGFPTNRWNITFAWLFVPFLPFPFLSFFLAVLYRKNNWTDFNAWWLIWCSFAQGSAFWGLQYLNSTFYSIFIQKYEKLQWCLWGKLNNALNRHNSCCFQDRVVIFDSSVWFSGLANLTVSVYLPPIDPRCHGNERNLGQNWL